jgi:hypothetical protein
MNHLLALYEWRVNLEDKNPNSLSWDWISGQRKLFVFYHPSFTRLNQANEITFYNAIILVLLKIGQEVIGQPYHPLIHTRPRNYPNCPIPAHSSPRQGRKTQSNCHWDLPQRRLQSTTLTIHDIQVILQERCHTSVSETNNGPITYFYFSATPEKLVFWMISSVYLETQVLLLAEHDPFTSNMMIPRNSQEMLRPSFVNLMIWTKTSAHDIIVTTLMSASKTHKTHLRHEEKLHP